MLESPADVDHPQLRVGGLLVLKWFHSLRFALKVAIPIGGLVAFGLVTIMLANYDVCKTLLRDSANSAAKSKVQATCRDVDAMADKGAILVRALMARQAAVGVESDPGKVPFMASLLNATPPDQAYDLYMYYDDTTNATPGCGVSRATWPNSMKNDGEDFHKSAWYADPKAAGKMLFTEPYYDETERVSMVSVVVPSQDKSGKFTGVAGVDFTLDKVATLLSKLSLIKQQASDEDFAFLVSRSGTIIAHPNTKLLIAKGFDGTKVTKLPGGDAIMAQPEGTTQVSVNNRPRLIFWSTAPLTGWKVCLEVSQNLIYAPLNTLTIRMILVALISAVVLVGLVYIISSNLQKPLTLVLNRLRSLRSDAIAPIGQVLTALEKGDLTTKASPIAVDQSSVDADEFARESNLLIVDINRMISSLTAAQSSLSHLVAQSSGAASKIALSAEELASGNADLSHRTSAQASNLEETAASMEEMTSIVKQNSENAIVANGLAAEAKDVAENGGALVARAVASMDEINSSSRRIADIITVMDEIAFQTNLLALNAAVEAARVGEQGRGFAVVASEVRNLAGRSSTAAKEIKALVQDSMAKVQDGTDLVHQSGDQLKAIVTAVHRVANIVSGIAAASQEQSAGIDQVNKAVAQMDEITQQNAGLVEEATASSQAMSHRASELQDLVSRFKFDDSHRQEAEMAQAPVTHIRQVASRATGTNGFTPLSTRRAALSVVSSRDEDIEEF